MLDWYKRNIVPKFIDAAMSSGGLEKVRHAVLRQAHGTVLEIGSGPGYNFSLYPRITKLYALEPSEELVEIAKGRASALPFPIEFIRSGAENTPLPDGSIDTVVSTWTLCSVTDPRRTLKDVARVLRPRGKFLFADHGASPNAVLHVAQTALTGITKHFTGNCHLDRSIGRLLDEAGFEVSDMQHPRERYKPLIYNYQGVATKK